jgi:hypothetical protein
LVCLLALSRTAQAQVEPAFVGSVEYTLNAHNYTWYETSDPIIAGTYVEDLISDWRWNQPEGRGRLGIVTYTAWDPDYGVMAAMVDFGRDYSVGIVFPELSAIAVVPEPSALLILLPGALLWLAARSTGLLTNVPRRYFKDESLPIPGPVTQIIEGVTPGSA